jgi:POT family proton-dependent oligopeptide transporter
MSKQGLLDIYELFGWIAIGAAVAVLVISPLIKKLMHLDTLKDETTPAADGIDEAYPVAARPAE